MWYYATVVLSTFPYCENLGVPSGSDVLQFWTNSDGEQPHTIFLLFDEALQEGIWPKVDPSDISLIDHIRAIFHYGLFDLFQQFVCSHCTVQSVRASPFLHIKQELEISVMSSQNTNDFFKTDTCVVVYGEYFRNREISHYRIWSLQDGSPRSIGGSR